MGVLQEHPAKEEPVNGIYSTRQSEKVNACCVFISVVPCSGHSAVPCPPHQGPAGSLGPLLCTWSAGISRMSPAPQVHGRPTAGLRVHAGGSERWCGNASL